MKTFFSNMNYLLKRIASYDKKLLLIIVFQVLISVILSYLGLWMTQSAVNMVINKSPIQEYILILSFLVLSFGLLSIINQVLAVQSKIKRQLFRLFEMNRLMAQVTLVDYQLLESDDYKETQEKAFYTVNSDDSLTQKFPDDVSKSLSQVLKLILFSTLLMVIDPLFLGLILALMLFVIVYRFYQQKYIKETQTEMAKYNNQIYYVDRVTSNFSLAKDISLFNVKPWFVQIFNEIITNKKRINSKRAFIVFGGQFLNALFILGLTAYGYYILINRLFDGSINIGQLTFYIGAMTTIATSSSEFINTFFDLRQHSDQTNELLKFVNYPNIFNHQALAKLPKEIHSIEFKDVTFRFPKSEKPLFDSFSIKLYENEKIAMVGLNGAGKTTFVKLLCNLYKPESGQILINGVDNQLFDVDEYYDLFSVVFQDHFDLPFTIKETVIQNSEFDPIRYDLISQQVNLQTLYKNLPHKEDTYMVKEVDPEAVSLSGGQHQKLKLAQALYKDAPILILDEPTSALDPLVESEIYQQYHLHSKDKLSLFITHRLATTQFCERILYLEDGKVVEDGTHQQLMKIQGKYYEMYEKQAYYYQQGELQ